MNIGATIHDIPIPIQPEADGSASNRRARAGQRRVIDLEPIAPAGAKPDDAPDDAGGGTDNHRGRIINLRV